MAVLTVISLWYSIRIIGIDRYDYIRSVRVFLQIYDNPRCWDRK